MEQQKSKNQLNIIPLDPNWTMRANPLLIIFKGGHRAKAGEWFLEIQRVLYDIYKSFVILENFLNRMDKDIFIGENKDRGGEKRLKTTAKRLRNG